MHLLFFFSGEDVSDFLVRVAPVDFLKDSSVDWLEDGLLEDIFILVVWGSQCLDRANRRQVTSFSKGMI